MTQRYNVWVAPEPEHGLTSQVIASVLRSIGWDRAATRVEGWAFSDNQRNLDAIKWARREQQLLERLHKYEPPFVAVDNCGKPPAESSD